MKVQDSSGLARPNEQLSFLQLQARPPSPHAALGSPVRVRQQNPRLCLLRRGWPDPGPCLSRLAHRPLRNRTSPCISGSLGAAGRGAQCLRSRPQDSINVCCPGACSRGPLVGYFACALTFRVADMQCGAGARVHRGSGAAGLVPHSAHRRPACAAGARGGPVPPSLRLDKIERRGVALKGPSSHCSAWAQPSKLQSWSCPCLAEGSQSFCQRLSFGAYQRGQSSGRKQVGLICLPQASWEGAAADACDDLCCSVITSTVSHSPQPKTGSGTSFQCAFGTGAHAFAAKLDTALLQLYHCCRAMQQVVAPV